PGGIGVIEASRILALTTAGAAAAPAAAAVLIYRLLSCWTILPIGLICWTAQKTAAPAPPSRDRPRRAVARARRGPAPVGRCAARPVQPVAQTRDEGGFGC